MAPSHPLDLSLASLRAAYQGGSLTPRAVMRQVQERARGLNAEFNAYITLLDDAALEPYLKRLGACAPGSLPLYGIPFAIKDNLDLAGVPTTAACPAYERIPETSAFVVERLIEWGAIPTGKTNLDQFATGLSGMRSPYGECRNAHLAEYSSGGSSSGSALAVALGLASFALGTDTAGSGRVPAALNGLVGVKPTRGLLSTRGLVPCCPSLDCVSLFATTVGEAAELFRRLALVDAADSGARRNPAWNAALPNSRLTSFRFGVPRVQDRVWLGCTDGPALFEQTCAKFESLGGIQVEIDFQPFLAAARLLYEAPGVAERYASFGQYLEPEAAMLPMIREIVGAGAHADAVSRIHAAHRLQVCKRECDRQLDAVDLVLCPTIPRAFTRAELREEPIRRNSELGTYTNFMNLLDYAAIAVPSGTQANGLPWGVTLFGRAFTDQTLFAIASDLRGETRGNAASSPRRLMAADRMRVVVCGAHLQGLPLNGQLIDRGARLVCATQTATGHRLYALPGGPPKRPALVRDASGRCIDVEVWELPSAELGSFLDGIGAPLGLGKVELVDGSVENGFICESGGMQGAEDITSYGGWRAWLAAR